MTKKVISTELSTNRQTGNDQLTYTPAMTSECLPFIKWAGGKRKITSLLKEVFPQEFNSSDASYFEPFIGGGALALSLGDGESRNLFPGTRLHLNDMNPDLVATYEVIRDSVDELIESLLAISKEFNELPLPDAAKNGEKTRADFYYEMRALEPEDNLKIATRLIFLNKTCFNGLWRVNSKGKFNVPYGHHKNPSLFDKDNLEECSRRLNGATISNSEFDEAVSSAQAGDLVYFDPPYIPLNLTSSFSQYSKNDFGISNQQSLAKCISNLTAKGVHVILSNSDTPQTREIFGDVLQLRRLLMTRFISASGAKRNAVYEVIGTNFNVAAGTEMSALEKIN